MLIYEMFLKCNSLFFKQERMYQSGTFSSLRRKSLIYTSAPKKTMNCDMYNTYNGPRHGPHSPCRGAPKKIKVRQNQWAQLSNQTPGFSLPTWKCTHKMVKCQSWNARCYCENVRLMNWGIIVFHFLPVTHYLLFNLSWCIKCFSFYGIFKKSSS